MLIFKMDRRFASCMPGSYYWLDVKEVFSGDRDRLDTLVCNTGLREVLPRGRSDQKVTMGGVGTNLDVLIGGGVSGLVGRG